MKNPILNASQCLKTPGLRLWEIVICSFDLCVVANVSLVLRLVARPQSNQDIFFPRADALKPDLLRGLTLHGPSRLRYFRRSVECRSLAGLVCSGSHAPLHFLKASMKADRRPFEVAVLLITFLLIGYPLWTSVPGACQPLPCP